MNKYCENCGKKLEKKSGLCPVCDGENLKLATPPEKNTKLIWILTCVVLVLVLTVSAAFALPHIRKESKGSEINVNATETTAQEERFEQYVVGDRFVRVNDRYIYTDYKNVYVKSSVKDEGQVIAELKNNGQIMAGSDKIFLTESQSHNEELSYIARDDAFTVYSMNGDGSEVKTLFTSVGSTILISYYDGAVYYLDKVSYDEVKFCKYDTATDEKTELTDIVNVNVSSYIDDAKCVGSKVYLHISPQDGMNNESLIEFDMRDSSVKTIAKNCEVVIYQSNPQAKFSYVTYTMANDIYRASDMYVYTINDDGSFTKSPQMPPNLDQRPEIISSDGLYALFMTSINSEDFNLYKVDLKSGDMKTYDKAAGRFKGKGYGISVDLINPQDIYFCGVSPMKFTDEGFVECECEKQLAYEWYWITEGYLVDREFKNHKLTEKSVEKATTSPVTDTKKSDYEKIIENYIDAHPWGMQMQIGEFEFVGEMHSMHDLNTMGYAYKDLDNNDTEELLIGPVGQDGTVYEIYTIVNDKVIQLTTSWSRSRNTILVDGSIINSGSSGACLSTWDCNVIDSDKSSLKVTKKVTLDGFYAEELGLISDAFETGDRAWFKSSSDNYEDYVNITASEARDIIDEWEETQADIGYTPFSQYK
ncbi:MAG: hypothetical protein E7513_04045 [Ruminococcaceae bacterium]|nr:hypothetical protein [Oscillospiraceae bacterium]